MAITATNNLKRGSYGNDVLELQKKMNTLGYNLAEDSSYGPDTEAAVRDYQTKNGLKVDGVVGTNTWGSMNNPATGTAAENTAAVQNATAVQEPTPLQAVESSKPIYEKSEQVKLAEQALAQYEQNKPAAYQGTYSDQIQGLLDQIMNREKFSYDFASDPMYQQYKQQYMQGGKQAMMDTTAQAAALSGGFGNSYGATAGNLAYQQYLNGLNDVIPDLYNAALSKYQMEGQNMQNNLSILQGLDEAEYGRYRDDLSDYYTGLNYQYGKTQDMSQEDYARYQDALNAWQADRDYQYGKERNEAQLAYQKEQDAQAQANWDKEFNFALQQYQNALANKGGSGGSGGGSSKSSSNNKKNNTDKIQKNSVSDSILDQRAHAKETFQEQIARDYEAGLIPKSMADLLYESTKTWK